MLVKRDTLENLFNITTAQLQLVLYKYGLPPEMVNKHYIDIPVDTIRKMIYDNYNNENYREPVVGRVGDYKLKLEHATGRGAYYAVYLNDKKLKEISLEELENNPVYRFRIDGVRFTIKWLEDEMIMECKYVDKSATGDKRATEKVGRMY